MRHLSLSILTCSLSLGLLACDKSSEPTQPPADEGGEQAQVAAPAEDDAFVSGVDDETAGFGGVIRDTVSDAEPAAPVAAEDAPKFDTALDAGGLIGHLAAALAHDDELASSATAAELVRLSGESNAPSDFDLCRHAWKIMGETYPDEAKGSEVHFLHDCKVVVEKQRIHLGAEIFAQQASCVLAAADLRALDVCDAAEHEAEVELHEKPHGDVPEDSVCRQAVAHIAELILDDLSGDPELHRLLALDIDAIKTDAIQVCHDEGTKDEIACVMEAAVLKDLETCTGA